MHEIPLVQKAVACHAEAKLEQAQDETYWWQIWKSEAYAYNIGRRHAHAAVLLKVPKFLQRGVYNTKRHHKLQRVRSLRGDVPGAGLARRSQGTSREVQPPAPNTRAYLHGGWGVAALHKRIAY